MEISLREYILAGGNVGGLADSDDDTNRLSNVR